MTDLYIFVGFKLLLRINMRYNYKTKGIGKWALFAFLLLFSVGVSNAQWGDWGDTEEDTTATDSTEEDGGDWGGGSWDDDGGFGFGGDDGQDDKGTPPKERVKYERIDHIPVDTLTKLITYTAVHDVENECEYCTSDSLYYRAKQYLLKKFGDGKKFPKKWIVEDTENQRIILNVRLPLFTQPNGNVRKQEGEYEFKFQLWIRDYAYKYKFLNFVHQDPVVAGKPGTFTPVYMEFYLKNKTKVRITDLLLKAIDRDMKELIADIVRVMKDPVTVDIDEEDF